MEFGIVHFNMGPLAEPGIAEAIAREAESFGFDSIWVNDHLLVPESNRMVPAMLYDPLTVLPAMAAVTERIRIGTSVLVVPLRNPVATAKAVATLDHMSGGRFIFGVGVGWLPEEFEAVGVDFHRRGAVTNEYLDVMQSLWTSDPTDLRHGSIHVPGVRMLPKPAQSPLPVWVSGNVPAGIERAAKRGTGWHPLNLSAAEFEKGVALYRDACGRAGKPVGDIALRVMPGPKPKPGAPFTGTAGEIATTVDAYAALGLTHCVFSPFARSAEEFCEAMRFLAEEVRPLVKS